MDRLPKANTDLKREVLSNSFLDINIHGGNYVYHHRNMVISWQRKVRKGPSVITSLMTLSNDISLIKGTNLPSHTAYALSPRSF